MPLPKEESEKIKNVAVYDFPPRLMSSLEPRSSR